MGKVKNLCLKKGLAIISTAFIAFTGTGCSIGGKKNDDGKNNSIVSIDEQTETVLSTIETTTTLKPFDKNSGCINHFDDDTSVVSDYVQTSYESDLTVSDITSTTAKSTDIIAEANKNDNTAKTSKSTIVKPTTTNVRITDGTTKIVNTTNAATPKPTTTVTTTTTEAVTEAPVSYSYDLYGISNGIDTFGNYSHYLYNDLISNSGYNDCFLSIDLGYGESFMGPECKLILQSLNYDNISDDVLDWNFTDYSLESLYDYKTFIYNFKYVLDQLNGDIDYAKYTLNTNVGNFLNEADQTYRDGSFDNFMIDKIVNGNVGQDILSNPGAMAILYSYDKGKYLDFNSVDYMLSSNIDHVCDVVNTNTFVK